MMRRLGVIVAIALCAWPAFALGPAVIESRLDNGAQLLVSEQRNLPLVVVGIMIDAGSRYDPRGRAGVANLTAELLTEGTKTRSAAAIKEEIDVLGGSLSVDADNDYTVLQMLVLKSDVERGLALLSDILLRPVFADAELARRKEAVLAQIRSQRDDPTHVAQLAFQQALFGSGSYGHPIEGTEATVRSISRADVRDFYARFYRPSGASIVVVGDIGAAEAHALFAAALVGWTGAGSPPNENVTAATAAAQVHIDKAVSQASIVLGHRGVARSNPDFEVISLMNYVLGGGGFSSRLMENIRTKAGLVYGVSSAFSTNKDPGSFGVVMQTKNASAADAISRARSEIQRLRDGGITEKELDDAKRYLTGSFVLRLDSMSEIARFIARSAAFGLGLDYADRYIERINAVTAADVQRVAQQYLHPDELIQVVVGDLSQAGLAPAP